MKCITPALIFCHFLSHILSFHSLAATQILSKSKLEKCEKVSDSGDLNCTKKIIVNMAVPSESSGREASMVAEIAEVEENSTDNFRALRVPPIITVYKSASYALYQLTYIRDVAYKPEELYVKTRKCEPDAGAKVVKTCERLRDENGHIIQHTEPICCPCGNQRRIPSSCGDFFDKMLKGKANTAHCLRYAGEWFHVFGIGQRSLGFSIRIEVKTPQRKTEVVVGPENRTVTSSDNFLRVNLVGDYAGYTNIPSFEDYYLVVPRQGGPGQPDNLGRNFSTWMLLERVRFTLDGVECNKIGVGYDAFNGQPSFCSSPFWSCLHNQLWNFQDADKNRISRNQIPLYLVEGRFVRINEHPTPGSHSFSIGITEVLNTNLLIELTADDIEYVYQRSPGKIIDIAVPTFEALTQFGTATITTKNIGEVEASYSLTFNCSAGVGQMEEQFFIMKPKETATRPFKLYPTTDQAAKYICSAILKDSGFSEVDRAECQFTTKATIIDNGSQIPFWAPETSMNGFFDSIKRLWNKLWSGFADFMTSKSCREKCSSFFDMSCHIQYICISWIVMFGVVLAIFPTVMVLVWLLHEKGHFDPLYDWWEDHCYGDDVIRRRRKRHHHMNKRTQASRKNQQHRHKEGRHQHMKKRTDNNNQEGEAATRRHGRNTERRDMDYEYELHRVQKQKQQHKHRHRRNKSNSGSDHHHHPPPTTTTNINNNVDKRKDEEVAAAVNNRRHHIRHTRNKTSSKPKKLSMEKHTQKL
ncbi:protein HAPLESS 2 [Impatiens glandulifera]|uniref:protein HAPLESS 2 n=1 Tax=Impatiens glandulifera TaxID=253017 RepID=UPI001FB1A085|nr:protein HAPLESS 2 [Impatiens glandulifera]